MANVRLVLVLTEAQFRAIVGAVNAHSAELAESGENTQAAVNAYRKLCKAYDKAKGKA